MTNNITWVKCVRDISKSLGFDVWLYQEVGNVYDVFISLVKQKVNDNFVQNWYSEVCDSTIEPRVIPFDNRKCRNCIT